MLCNIDQIRQAQEQRIMLILKSWDEAKKNLEIAIALTQTREREYHEISEDVRRKLAALDLVTSMAAGLENELPEEKRISAGEENQQSVTAREEARGEMSGTEMIVASPVGVDSLVRRSSHPLFSPLRRTA